jgi:putative MFS transporter
MASTSDVMRQGEQVVLSGQRAGSVSDAAITNGRVSRLLASMDQSNFSKRHAALYATVIFFHFFDGFDVLMMGTVLPGIRTTFNLTSVQGGVLVSSTFIGMLIGAVMIPMLADQIGRKRALFLAIAWYAVFSLVAATATSYNELFIVRLLEGVGLGAEVPLVFTYVVEFVPTR